MTLIAAAQVYAAIWVLAVALFLHIRSNPFIFQLLTNLELLSLVVTFIILMCSQVRERCAAFAIAC